MTLFKTIEWPRLTWASISLGVLFGLIAVPLGMLFYESLQDLYERAFPVVVGVGVLEVQTKEELVVHLTANKRRDCKFMRVNAYGIDLAGQLELLNLVRVDGPPAGATHPVGNLDLGHWKIWPTSDAVRVMVNVQHLCGSRIVVTTLSNLPLKLP